MTKPQHARRTPNKLLALVGLAVLALMAVISPVALATTGEDHQEGGKQDPGLILVSTELEGLSDGDTFANAVNDQGVAVGGSTTDAGRVFPVRWDAQGNVERLGFHDGKPFIIRDGHVFTMSDHEGVAHTVNSRGFPAGVLDWDRWGEITTWWQPDGDTYRPMDSLPSPEGARTTVTASNDAGTHHGDLVGVAERADGTTDALYWREGESGVITLPTLQGDRNARANDINEHGWIVGVSNDGHQDRAILWRP